MTKLEADKILPFLRMLHKLQGVRRTMHVPGEDRFENDIEHSYLLAMCVWYAIDTYKLPLDRDRAIRYALAHDMPEVHAGDTYIFTTDASALESKKDREAEARKQLVSEFPSVRSMHEAMETYEQKSDAEAVFVRALDKLMPVFDNYIQDGRTLKENGVCFSQVAESKRRTTKDCPEVSDLLEQMLALFDEDRARFFGKNVH